MAKVTWLGDSDPAANSVEVGGRHFVKGVAVDVPDDMLGKLKGNPTFSTEDGAKAVAADEPGEDERDQRAEQGTVKAALRAQLREMGDTITGNPSEETLRRRLAKKMADANAAADEAEEA
jgi:hypothetical protein